MQLYTVGPDLKLIPIVTPKPSKEKLKIGESVNFFDKRRMSMNIAEVLPTKEDNLNSYKRLAIGDSYRILSYFPSRVGEEIFTGKLVEKEFVDGEYPVFKFNTDDGKTRIISTYDLYVTLTRVK